MACSAAHARTPPLPARRWSCKPARPCTPPLAPCSPARTLPGWQTSRSTPPQPLAPGIAGSRASGRPARSPPCGCPSAGRARCQLQRRRQESACAWAMRVGDGQARGPRLQLPHHVEGQGCNRPRCWQQCTPQLRNTPARRLRQLPCTRPALAPASTRGPNLAPPAAACVAPSGLVMRMVLLSRPTSARMSIWRTASG